MRQDPGEGGHTIQPRQEGVQWETKGDKGTQDLREGGLTIQQRETRKGTWETKGDKGRQDPREGGHTIQHQGGHLKKALRTPNSTLFGAEKASGRNIVRGNAVYENVVCVCVTMLHVTKLLYATCDNVVWQQCCVCV